MAFLDFFRHSRREAEDQDAFEALIDEGDLVYYHQASFSFEGIVIAVDFDSDLALVEMEDQFGVREYLCGFERLHLLLKKAALEAATAAASA